MTGSSPPDPSVLRMERTFNAPAEVVFDAWTSVDVLRRWWPAGAGWDTPIADVDLRVGGRLRLVMRSPTGEQYAGQGSYVEISRPTRLVFTWKWDSSGSATQLVEVSFTKNADATTTVVLINRGLSEDETRSHREGWEASFRNLDHVFGEHVIDVDAPIVPGESR